MPAKKRPPIDKDILDSSRYVYPASLLEMINLLVRPKLLGATKSAVLGWSNKLHAPDGSQRSKSEDLLLGAATNGEPLSSNPYKYQPIPTKRQIRLIELYPGSQSGALHCRIFLASIDKLPEYEAISYTWGDPEHTVCIECNSNRKQLYISYNLGVALQNLRRKDESRILWVDAICINQKNVVERGAQVQLMREIYRHAQRVVAWVGEEDEADAAAMNLGGLMTQLFNRKEATRERSIIKAGKVSAFAIQDAWKALAKFIKRPWFGRVWIVQEMAIPTHLLLQCGQRTMDWDEFSRAIKLLHMQSRSALAIMKIDSSLERLEVLAAFRAGVQADSRKIGGDLYSNVIGTRLFSSTDPRDHIYALLGVTDRLDDSSVVPDYSRGFEELYCQFVKNAIRQNGNLDILGQADSPFNDELPSWVPDWRRFWRVRPLSSKQNTQYRASGGSLPCARDGPNRRILVVSGKIIDKIQTLGPGFKPPQKVSLGPLDSFATDAIDRVLEKFQSYLQIWLSDTSDKDSIVERVKIPAMRSKSPNSKTSEPTRALISSGSSERIDYRQVSNWQGLSKPSDSEDHSMFSSLSPPTETQRKLSVSNPVCQPSIEGADFTDKLSKQISQLPSPPLSTDNRAKWPKVSLRSKSPSSYSESEKKPRALIPRVTSPPVSIKKGWITQAKTPSPPSTPASLVEVDDDTAVAVTTITKPAKTPSRKTTAEHDLEVFSPEIVIISHAAEALQKPDSYSENANQYLQQNLGTTVGELLPIFQRILLNMIGLGSSKTTISSEMRTTPTMEAGCRAIAETCGERYVTGESIEEAYWRTLIGDQIRGEFDKVRKPTEEWGIVYKIWLSRLAQSESYLPSWVYKDPDPDLKIPQTLNQRFDDAVRPESQLVHYVQYLNISSLTSKIFKSGLALIPNMLAPKVRKDILAKEFTMDVLHTAQNRQFCATEKLYMGWAPPDAQVGDLVCVLQGGRVPFLLRPHGNMYQLIGELYIHGLMDGQAMTMKGFKTQELFLA